MRFPVLPLITGFASMMSLAAQEDPFASYHRVIEERLVSMSEAGSAVSRKATEILASSERKIVPAITVADLAFKFWGGRDIEVSAAVSRLQQYRSTVEHILEQEGIPKGLVAMVLVESGAQRMAVSPKQARGLWQLIPATARQYGHPSQG